MHIIEHFLHLETPGHLWIHAVCLSAALAMSLVYLLLFLCPGLFVNNVDIFLLYLAAFVLVSAVQCGHFEVSYILSLSHSFVYRHYAKIESPAY